MQNYENFQNMPFTVRCIPRMVTSVSPSQQYMFAVRSMLIFDKELFVRNELASSLQPPASFFALDFQKLVDKCLNKFVQYVGHLTFEWVCPHSFFF